MTLPSRPSSPGFSSRSRPSPPRSRPDRPSQPLSPRQAAPPPPAAAVLVAPARARPTRSIAALQAALADDPGDADCYAALGNAYLQKVARDRRPVLLRARPDRLSSEALRRDPRDAGALTGMGVAGAGAPRLPRRAALRIRGRTPQAPEVVRPLRRDRRRARSSSAATARPSADAADDGRPQAQPRLLRARLLLPGAARRPATARSRRCGSRSRPAATRPRTSPTCRRCSATSSSTAASLGAARRRRTALALARFPGYVRRRCRPGARRVPRADDLGPRDPPLPRRSSPACRCRSTSIALGEAELAAGRARRRAPGPRARRSRAAPAAQRTASTPTPSWRVFEADHGSPGRAVDARPPRLGDRAERALGRRARLGADPGRAARRGPSLGRAGAAARLASTRPFLYHAGISAKAAGRPGLARGWLRSRARAQPALLAAARRSGPSARWGACDEARLLIGRRRLRAGSRARAGGRGASARELLDQPHHAGPDLGATGSTLVHPRPGRDPDLPGARPLARRGARPQAGGGRARTRAEVNGRADAARASSPARRSRPRPARAA